MNKVRSGIALGLSLILLSVFATDAFAVFEPCNISGEDGVILDSNDNDEPDGGDTLFRLEYDPDPSEPAANNLRIYMGPDVEPMWEGHAYPTPDGGWVIVFPGPATLALAKMGGNPYLNSGSWGQYGYLVNGVLVDASGDGEVDQIMLSGDPDNPYIPAAMMDIPLMFHFNDGDFWMLPRMLPYGPAEVDIKDTYFIPVDVANKRIYVQCGGPDGPILAEARSETAPLAAIPTTSFWGYGALVSLLFAAGIWGMRRIGVGNGLSIG